MKKVVAFLLLLAGLAAIALLDRDPQVQGQQEASAPATEPAGEDDLIKRIAALEQAVSFHSHNSEMQSIEDRLARLEAEANKQSSINRKSKSASTLASNASNTEMRKLKQDVQSLSAKMASLERSVGPLKQDIAKLKRSLMQLESTVTRIDLRR